MGLGALVCVEAWQARNEWSAEWNVVQLCLLESNACILWYATVGIYLCST